MKKPEEYVCGLCAGIFLTVEDEEWNSEKSEKEAHEVFGKPTDEWNDEKISICDGCYKEINPLNHPDILEEAKKFI